MKAIRDFMLTAVSAMLTVTMAFSQNYKAPKIDASGKVTDESGMVVASVSKDGTIKDAKGNTLGKIEKGSLNDKMGVKMGQVMENGSFKDGSGTIIYTVSAPDAKGMCSIMDQSGNVVGTVDKAQLKYGGCVMHCLKNGMDMKH